MRILVVGAVSGATVDIGSSLAYAFTDVGEECHFLDFSEYQQELRTVNGARSDVDMHIFLIKLQTRLLEEVLLFNPTHIIGLAQSPLNNVEVLDSFRKSGIRLSYWFLEDYRVFQYWRKIAPKFDNFFTIQKSRIFKELKDLGCDNGYYLAAAFDDLPSSIEASDKSIDAAPLLSFVGAPYRNRINMFNDLKLPGLEIYGEGWNGLNTAVKIGDRRITPSERRHIYVNSKINLNLHSSSHGEGDWNGDFVNPRTFEIAGLGGFQLTDTRELLPLHFDLKNEIPVFESPSSMLDAIKYYMSHDSERNEMATNARARVLKEHTYRHRAMEILSLVS
jgi:spore maturation protein CgeB